MASEQSERSKLRSTAKVDFSKKVDLSAIKGKFALVADSATGLGFGIATGLAENGAHVAICDEDDTKGEAAVKDLTSKGYTAKFFHCEYVNWDSQLACFKNVLAWSEDKLDIVVTTTGIVTTNLMLSILPKHYNPDEDPRKPPTKVLDIDLMGVYYNTSLALFYFNKIHEKLRDPSYRPQLIFICSMAGYEGIDFGTDYAAAKQGVRSIFKSTKWPRPGMAKYQSNLLAPTYVRKNTWGSRSEAELRDHHHQVNEIGDVVAAALRCVCDETIEGRAIACVQGTTGTPGKLNFDLCDDLIDHSGGRELCDRVEDIWLPSSAKLSEDHNCKVQ